MVRVLVGHQDRIEVGQRVPGIRHVSRIDQDPLISYFNENAGVPQVCQLHTITVLADRGLGADQGTDDLTGTAALVTIDVEMGDCAQHEGAERRYPYTLHGGPRRDLCR